MIEPLAGRIMLVRGENEARYPYSNCLFIDDRVKAMVDSGVGENHLACIPFQDVEVIINTHYHPDHILLNRRFPRAEVWAHRLDSPPMRSREAFLDYTGFRSLGDSLAGRIADRVVPLLGPVHRELEGGEVLSFGEVTLTVLHTPGHSPGHCSLWAEKEGVLFLADIDLTPFGPWYGHLSGDPDAFLASLDLVAGLQPRLVVTSHREPLREGWRKALAAYREKIFQREEAILAFLDCERSLDEIVEQKLIYSRHPYPEYIYRFFESTMVRKHLDRLIRIGAVREENGRYRKN